MNPWLSPVLFWVVMAAGWLAFRVVARGWTQVHAERAIRKYGDRWGRITREVR